MCSQGSLLLADLLRSAGFDISRGLVYLVGAFGLVSPGTQAPFRGLLLKEMAIVSLELSVEKVAAIGVAILPLERGGTTFWRASPSGPL